jgi:FkbM family methyltransferase
MKAIFFEDLEHSFIASMLKEMFVDRIYDPFFEDIKDPIVIDAGANVGIFTLYAYPKSSKIYAIEPSQSHFDTLSEMLNYNKMLDKVVPIKLALANENGKADLFHPLNPTARSLIKLVGEISDKKDTEIVETITMDKLFTQYNIDHVDFLKLDVEGAEMEIIGGKGFESICPKINSLLVEWHSWTNTEPYQIFNALSDYGYKVWPIRSGDVTLLGARRDG